MSRLEDFLNFQDVDTITEEIYINKRLGSFKVKPLTATKHNEFRNRCLIKNKKGETITDLNKFNLLVITEQTLEPDFSNAEFLSKVNCQTAREFIEKKFLSGEIITIANKILEISGFNIDINEQVEEAKNS